MNFLISKDAVHHLSEAAGCITLGAFAFSSIPIAVAGYTIAKVCYVKKDLLVDNICSDVSKSNKRLAGLFTVLLANGIVLEAFQGHLLQGSVSDQALSLLSTLGMEVFVAGGGIAMRSLADEGYKCCRIKEPKELKSQV